MLQSVDRSWPASLGTGRSASAPPACAPGRASCTRVDPTEPFEALVATLEAAFPGHAPNSREFPYVPHVTIAEAAAGSMTSLAPPHADVSARADRILLLAEGADGRWRTRWWFPLRADGGISA